MNTISDPSLRALPSARQAVANDLAGLYGVVPGAQLSAWIDGAAVEGEGQPIPLIDPASGEELLRYPDSGMGLAIAAARGAAAAQQEWAALSGIERSRRMLGWALAVREAASELASLEAGSAGRPAQFCHADVTRAADTIEYFAGWADKLDGIAPALPAPRAAMLSREPLGTVAVLLSWRHPLLTAAQIAAPAIAAGNAVILKPSKLTPLSALVLGLLGSEGGLPRGLLQVVPGHGVTTGNAVVAQDAVRKVVFCGDPGSAGAVARHCAERLKSYALHTACGSAGIVFEDADEDLAIAGAMRAAFGSDYQVQGCRLLVHQDRYRDFVSRAAKAAARLRLGPPLDAATQMGPMPSARRLKQAQSLLDKARSEGAWLAASDLPETLAGSGQWMAPSVVAKIGPQSILMRERFSAPILAILPFTNEQSALRLIQESATDEPCAVYSQNTARAHRVASALHADTVWINDAGAPRVAMRDQLADYTSTKTTWFNTGATASDKPAFNL